jgi:hypothetical protein
MNFGGMTFDGIVNELTKTMSKADALEMVGSILIQAGQTMGRTFSYGATFPKTDPGCGAKFARTLVHKDWKDGQDLVQAEESTGELGFNVRFHAVEADLDALGTDVKKAFSCQAEIRSSLADRLGEIKAELNRINQDLKQLQACCEQGERVQIKEPGDHYVGRIEWFGTPMDAYNVGGQIVLFPPVPRGPITNGSGDPRVKNVAELGKILTKNQKIKDFIKQHSPVSKNELVKEFGDLEAEGGLTLEDLVDILPDQGRYSTPESLLKAVAERQAAAIRTSGGGDQVIAAAFGGELPPGAAISGADVSFFQAVPPEQRAAMSAAGVKTIGALAKQTPQVLSANLKKAGVETSLDDAAGWIAAAETLMGLQ